MRLTLRAVLRLAVELGMLVQESAATKAAAAAIPARVWGLLEQVHQFALSSCHSKAMCDFVHIAGYKNAIVAENA